MKSISDKAILVFAQAVVVIENPINVQSFQDLLNILIDFIFWVGITVAPVVIIIAGFFYVISAGDPQKVETAKKMIWYAVIGLIVLLFARGLVAVLKSVLGYQG